MMFASPRSLLCRQDIVALAVCLPAMLAGCGKQEAPAPGPLDVTVLKVDPRDTPVMFEFIALTPR